MAVLMRGVCIALSVGALAALGACGEVAPESASAAGPSAAVPSSASPAPTPSTPPAAPGRSPLRDARWETVTGFRCPAADQKVVVEQVRYGDLTGDGVADAVVALTCTTSTSSNPLNVEAFDGASDPAHPRSLGVLVRFDDPLYVEKVTIAVHATSVELDGLGVGPDAPMAAGPTVHFTQTFDYRDGHLRPGVRHAG